MSYEMTMGDDNVMPITTALKTRARCDDPNRDPRMPCVGPAGLPSMPPRPIPKSMVAPVKKRTPYCHELFRDPRQPCIPTPKSGLKGLGTTGAGVASGALLGTGLLLGGLAWMLWPKLRRML